MSEYLTVSQYARLKRKDPGNIRRMLIKGTLKGEKFGNQWVIPKEAEYPEDKRVRSGDYRNWRKKISIRQSDPPFMKMLGNLCDKLGRIYGKRLERIVLYGSYARGEQTDGSDVDIALVLKGSESAHMHDAMTDLVVDYELENNLVLSVITVDQANFLEWRKVLPFYMNIDKEGIVLWKKA